VGKLVTGADVARSHTIELPSSLD